MTPTTEQRLLVIEELISEQYARLAWLERKRDQLRAELRERRPLREAA